MINILKNIISYLEPLIVKAQDYQPLAEGIPIRTETVEIFLSDWFKLLVGAATILAVIWIVLGGIQYMSTDAWSGKSEGKEKIKNALLGLLLAGASWLILYTIDEDIVNIRISENTNQQTQNSS